jgi:hypothetical protein
MKPKIITPRELQQIERHLNLIRKKLWEGQEYGRTAVLVGAGFSRNAVKRSPNTLHIPLWKDVGKSMYEKLYPGQTPPNNIEALKIATEFEPTFGRQALEEFLINRISDENYFPSKLYKLLLSLPWADIFTTNYDTLIERTREYIYDRKYDLVRRIDEIPYTSKPRIVKLHGTLPSFKPLIISEEDYRTYPTKFAPFVNIVQESIMENTFCLIGFSGNDPNFLNWTGWVRDNLGSSMPPIYLIGILDISEPQQKVYESKNIIPIDLSKLFPKLNYPDEDLRYYKAAEWLLWYLAKGAPFDYHYWPSIKPRSIPFEMSKDLPEIPESMTFRTKRKLYHSKNATEPTNLNQKNEAEVKDELIKLHKEWKDERELYPGWIVLPRENRKDLWMYSKYWLEDIKYVEKLEPPYDLFLLYELNWRIEKSLMPLLSNWLGIYKRILEKYNPFPSLLAMDKAQILPNKEKYNKLDWSKISKQWVELAFTLSRDAREDLNKKEFGYWMNCIQQVTTYNKEWKARWYYEKAMFSLLSLDLNAINKVLKDWPEDFEVPYWELKRASILTEIGELEKAEKIAEEVLNKTRLLQQPGKIDYYLLSLEGWTIILLEVLKKNRPWVLNGKEKEILGYYKGRLYKLNAYLCNPYNEIEPLKARLLEDKPPIKPFTETKQGFDPGRKESTMHLYGGAYSELEILSPAFNFLRMLEDGAMPLKCSIVDMWSETVINASKWLRYSSPLFSILSFLRAGKSEEKVVDKFFNRLVIATLEENELERLINIFIPAWKQSIGELAIAAKSSYAYSFSAISFKMLSEIISRLCFRLKEDQLGDIYKTVIYLYSSPIFSQYNIFYEVERNLLNRLLYSLSNEYIIEKLPELISLPLLEEDFQLPPSLTSRFPEPFAHIEKLKIPKKIQEKFETLQWHKSVEKLIEIVENGKVEPRKRAITRLSKLDGVDLLTENEKKRFAEALWKKIDPQKELPKNTGLTDSEFLFLPMPDSKKIKDKFKEHLINYTIQPFNGVPNTSLNDFLNSLLTSTKPLILKDKSKKNLYIDWNAKEASGLFEKIILWWDKEKDKLKKYLEPPWKGMFSNEIQNAVYKIFYVLNDVIFPRLKPDKTKLRQINNFFEDTKTLGFHPLLFLPGVLMLDPNKYEDIKGSIRMGLLSSDGDEVTSALTGVYCWANYNNIFKDVLKIPQELIDELILKITLRQQPELDLAIKVLINIIKTVPDMLQEEQAKNVCLASEFLLQETKLPKNPELLELKKEEHNKVISLDEITTYRELSSRLAFDLKNWYVKKNKAIPEVIQKCEETYVSDCLPEVRKIWY